MERSVALTPSWLCQAELLDRLGKKERERKSTDILGAAGLQTVFLTEFYTGNVETVGGGINSLVWTTQSSSYD